MVTVDIIYPGLTNAAVPIRYPGQETVYALYCTGMTTVLTSSVLDGAVIPRLRSIAQTLTASLASGAQSL